MTLLLSNEDVEKALTPADTIAATEQIYRELADGVALNRARSQVYLPAESKNNPGFHYRFKSQEGGSPGTGVWALRITSDMAGHSFTAGVKRRRILPVATGNRYCGLVILFDIERIEPVAIMPDGVMQKMRVAALSAVGAKYLAPDYAETVGFFGSGWQASAHLEYLCSMFDFETHPGFQPECRALSRVRGKHGTEAWAAASMPSQVAKEAVEGSDFIQAATAAWDPVFDGHWVEKGCTSRRSADRTPATSGAKSMTRPFGGRICTLCTRRKSPGSTNPRISGRPPKGNQGLGLHPRDPGPARRQSSPGGRAPTRSRCSITTRAQEHSLRRWDRRL